MTVMLRAALLGAALLAPMPADAACHKFSYWGFPWPQKCGPSLKPAPLIKRIYLGPPDPPAILPPIKEIALPDAVFIAAQPADKETALRLMALAFQGETNGR